MNILSMISDGGVASYTIVLFGSTALALGVVISKRLFVSYAIDLEKLYAKIKHLVTDGEVEQAIELCGQQKSPIASSLQSILERYDRSDEAIYQAQDIALAETTPKIGQSISHLAMIANVSTLVGLLGTVHGLILSFSAVSSADPAQKQTLLAEGISIAMSTTALGLTVAIPTMILYAFLNSKSQQLTAKTYEYSNRLVELLTTGHFQRLEKETLFPENMNKSQKEAPPAVELKAA